MKKLLAFISKFSFINTRVISVFSVILLLAIGANAQSRRLNDGSTPLGITPGSPAGAFSLSNFDTINPYNGNLNFRLPLIGVSGRGSSGYAVTLPINYRWTVRHQFDQPNQFYRHHPQSYRPGWLARPDFKPGKFEIRRVRDGSWCYPGEPLTFGILTIITFTTADGTEYEFRDELNNGNPQTGYCGSPPDPGRSRGTVWITGDGSFMTFVSDFVIRDLDATSDVDLAGYLMFPDGTKYRIDGGQVSWIRDRNGNLTTFTYSGGRLNKVTDSIGREITFAYDVPDAGQYGLHDQITYKGIGGQTRTIRISYKSLAEVLRSDQTLQTYQVLFGLDSTGQHNPANHIAAVWLPNGQSYRFYYNSYSELARIELPTGGAFEYDWGASLSGGASSGVVTVETNTSSTTEFFPEIYRRVLTKRIYPDGGTGNSFALKTTFSQTQGQGTATSSTTIEQRDTSNNLLGQTKHYFHGNPIPSLAPEVFFRPAWNESREYQTEIFDIAGGTPVLKRRINQIWQNGIGTGYNEGNARVTETVITLIDTNQVAKTTAISPVDGSIGFDQFNNPTDVWEYDFGTTAPGEFKRRTHTDYVTETNYTSHTGSHLRSLPLQTWISSDTTGNNKASLTQFEYDTYTSGGNYAALVSRSNVSGHDSTNYGTNHTRRGNVTRVTSYGNAQMQTEPISIYSQYDILGNIVKTIDGRGNASTISYADNFGSSDGEARTNLAPTQLNGQSTFVFPTSATNALNWVTGYSQVDYDTGQAVDTEDINGNVSSIFYNDLLDRPTQTIVANNRPTLRSQQSFIYDDANRKITATADLFTFGDNLSKAESFSDALGRTTETRSYKDGGFVVSKIEYDALGRSYKQSNPYRPHLNETAIWTTTFYDALSRVIKVKTPDNAEVLTSYAGNAVTVTDQAGKQRRSITNALGQLSRIDEPSDLGQLGNISNPNQPTSYGYDILGNLITVNQGVQTRSFDYDSLSRLKTATNPEAGTIQYGYDANSNLTQKTDARAIITTFTYDALNRVLTRSYSDTTPQVSYTYDDVNVPNSKGRLTKISSTISQTEYISFDELGKVLAHKQTTDGNAYTMAYNYNLSGALIEQTYPSGRVVKNVLDTDGDLSIVQSKKNQAAGFFNYAKNFTYTASGAVSSMQLGNGRWESTQFNSRLQPTQIALGTVQNGTDKLKLNFDYGQTQNNGNVLSQTITVPTVGTNQGFTAIQNYTYDNLNRLKSATETIGTQTWKQTFLYDRYGNRNFDVANTTTLGSCPANQCNPTIDTANNRFTSGQGYIYDLAGKVITDSQGRQFTYDAENKQKEVKDANNISIGQYFYDGDGKRVKKFIYATQETTLFVYDASGKMIAEYSTALAQTPQVSYLTQDHLGSPRILTDTNGNTISRRDFMPFGEEIYTQQRTQGLGYTTDNIRQKFATYERDIEADLDFAQNRYYNPKHGRFTTPDEAFADQYEENPQSWNLYSYVRNNPLKLVDPSGTSADEPGFWEKLGNLWNYGYFVGNEEIQKMEQERREWLTKHIFWKDKDGNWHPIDVTNFTTQDVFDVYREMKSQNESGELTQLTDSEASTARGLDPLAIAPSTIAPTTTANPGPSGKVSTEKFLNKNWDKATFGSKKKSIEYHVKKHGKGLTSTQYTQQAIKAFKDSGATRTLTTDKSGRAAVQVVSKHGTGLYTKAGKIIWFQPK